MLAAGQLDWIVRNWPEKNFTANIVQNKTRLTSDGIIKKAELTTRALPDTGKWWLLKMIFIT